MFKYIIIILLPTIVLSETVQLENQKKSTIKSDIVINWDKGNEEINDPQLKKELMQLKEDFKVKTNSVNQLYDKQIKQLHVEKENNISGLKEEFFRIRKELIKEYNVDKKRKPEKIKRKKLGKSGPIKNNKNLKNINLINLKQSQIKLNQLKKISQKKLKINNYK